MREGAPATKRRYWLGGNRHDAQDRFFREALDPELWEPGDENAWDACWYTGMPTPRAFDALTSEKWVNHIPGNNALTVKSRLAATLAAVRERMVDDGGPNGEAAERMGYVPETFAMPDAYHAFQAAALAEPSARWILKPKNASKGRGIRLVEDAAAVPTGERWMVQRYIHEPHTIRGHKYVLRLYVLITSVEPLRVYLYHEGFAKLASEAYDLDDPTNVFSHLTNPDINETNTSAAAPVVFIPFAEYRPWLREQGHDDAALFDRIHDLVTLTAIAAREPLRSRLAEVAADTRGCYELLGIDCLIDARLKPWIMECNLSPSLDVCAAPEDGGEIEYRVKRQLVHDMVAMLRFNRSGPEHADLDGAARLAAEAETERAHAGGWQRLYPHTEPERHLPFFVAPRLADVVLADAVAGRRVRRPSFCRYRAAELLEPDHLALYAEDEGVLYHPNPTATWLWLHASAGLDPDEIAEQLAVQRGVGEPASLEAVRAEVWDQLAAWAVAGLLRQTRGSGTAAPATAAPGAAEGEPETRALRVGAVRATLRLPSAPVRRQLEEVWAPAAETTAGPAIALRVLETARGYGVVSGERVLADRLTLAEIGPRLVDALLEAAAGSAGAVAAAVLALDGGRSGVLVAPVAGEQGDAPALRLADALETGLGGGLRLEAAGGEPLGLPLRLPADHPGVRRVHRWPDGSAGGLVATAAFDLSPITAVLVPQAAGEPLAPVGAAAALAALLPGYRCGSGRAPTAGEVTRLHGWLEQRPCLALPTDGPEAAVAALAERFAAASTPALRTA